MKNHIIIVLFFSGLWGLSEAVFGGILYRYDVPCASIILTVIALGILTIAKLYLPAFGSCAVIGVCAMLYKFLNEPFFACHLFAIFLLGLSYDLACETFKKNKVLRAIFCVYLSYISFAVFMTYIVKYSYWIDAGKEKFINYIVVSATLSAIGSAIIVPLIYRLFQGFVFTRNSVKIPNLILRTGLVAGIGLWIFPVVALLF